MIEDDVPELKMNTVRSAVHELLLLLCTSAKKGILFRQQNSSGSGNPNQLVLSLLEVTIFRLGSIRDELCYS